jgi:hypothetical protein
MQCPESAADDGGRPAHNASRGWKLNPTPSGGVAWPQPQPGAVAVDEIDQLKNEVSAEELPNEDHA